MMRINDKSKSSGWWWWWWWWWWCVDMHNGQTARQIPFKSTLLASYVGLELQLIS
jgi:hypothetical protein